MKPPMLFGRPMERVQVGDGPAHWRASFGSWVALVCAGNGEWRYDDKLAFMRSVTKDYKGADGAAAADLERWLLRELEWTAAETGFRLVTAGVMQQVDDPGGRIRP
jgi:hypothetical protein